MPQISVNRRRFFPIYGYVERNKEIYPTLCQEAHGKKKYLKKIIAVLT